MRSDRSRRFPRAVAGLLLSAAAVGPLTAAPASPRTDPRLVVLVSVDGLSWPRLESYRPWFVAGFKRLLEEGQVETRCRYRHLNTETGPGHSSLSTGAPPRVTGIVANRWFEQNPDGSIREVGCAAQLNTAFVPGTPPLFYQEVEKEGRIHAFASKRELEAWQKSGEIGKATTRLGYGPKGETLVFDGEDAILLFNLHHGRPAESFPPRGTIAGPGNLRVPTLGDRLVDTRPGSRVVSLSAKDRSAILLAGRDARHAVYWFDQASGRFTTSAAYDTEGAEGAAASALVARFNSERAGATLPARFGTRWTRLPVAAGLKPPSPPPLWTPTAGVFNPYPTPGLLDFQIPANGLDFDHDLATRNSAYFTSLYASPFIDETLTDLALTFVTNEAYRLGRGKGPDVLAISFSAQDVVSHSYGPESEENLDVLRRLDVQLGLLLDAIDRLFPKGSVVLALSADHGFSPIPESEKRWDRSLAVGRLVTGARGAVGFVDRLNRLLADVLCVPAGSRVIHGGEGWNLIYNRPALPMRTVAGACGPADRLVTSAEVDAALPRVMEQFFREEIEEVLLVSQRSEWPKDDPAVEFARNDFDPQRSGDAFLIPRPYVLMHWDPARGSGHGSHYDYDTNVPLVFWGGPFHAAEVSSDTSPYDLAPTLARLLGITLPDAVGASLLR
jgi:predicted AlkP superfamily pyrophosphatase or phosphodiesterase